MSGMNTCKIILYVAVLIYATITDSKTLMIKDRVHITIILLSFIGMENRDILKTLIGALMITIPFLFIAVKTDQLGGGDVKFIFANGVFLGFTKNYFGILIGLFSVIVMYVILKFLRKIEKGKRFPLIPHLSFGYFVVSILNQLLVNRG